MNKKKLFLVLLTMFVATAGAYAQGNGMAGINAATKMVTSYFDPGTKLIYAIGAVVGLSVVSRSTTSFPAVIQTRVRPLRRGLARVSS